MTEDLTWNSAKDAPYGRVIWVRNPVMEKPIKATRGYVHNGAVHEDNTLFTSVFTNDRFFPFPSGQLVIPTEWAEIPASE